MPSTATLPLPASESRIPEILALVRKAFIEKGFDGASMQDLARSAGMSVGNFYRYFPSKDAIIEALVAWDMEEIDQDFARIAQSPDPMATLRHVLAERIADGGCEEDSALWAEICAAAKRKPRIAEVSARMEGAIVAKMVGLFQLVSQNTDPARTRIFTTEAQMIVLLVKACAMHVATEKDADDVLKQRVQRTIDDILNALSKDLEKC
jgi:AcrR family transcriptional regulator